MIEVLRALPLLIDWNPVCLAMKMCLCAECVNKRLSPVLGNVTAWWLSCSGRWQRVDSYVFRQRELDCAFWVSKQTLKLLPNRRNVTSLVTSPPVYFSS